MMPSISVIIPVFNGEEFLERAIQSVLDQDLQPDELIVVDDGSTDQTASIARRYPKIKYIYQANQGPPAARNHGLEKAKGELIAFLDADDQWLPQKLSQQVAFLQSNPAIGYVLCHMHCKLAPGASWPSWLNQAHYQSDPPAYIPSALLVRRTVF